MWKENFAAPRWLLSLTKRNLIDECFIYLEIIQPFGPAILLDKTLP